MIVGDRELFGIESGITGAFPGNPHLGLGYFTVHIGGRSFGVKEPDVSMLGCSLNEVTARLAGRGTHRWPRLSNLSAVAIVEAFLDAIYRETTRDVYLGLTKTEFIGAFQEGNFQWAPDGDEAFDDSSYILQFDVDDKIRLIAFKKSEHAVDVANSVMELWIESELFYSILSAWRDHFTADLETKR